MNPQNIKFLNTRDESSALKLIEKAFGYSDQHRYKEDFLPLFDRRFDSHSINAYDGDKLIGHLGYCFREILINNLVLKFCFIGGIALENDYRGLGLFKTMMNLLIKDNESNLAGFLLWSSESKLYEKFGFKECGHIYQWGNEKSSNGYTKVESLSDDIIKGIKNLYEQTWKNRVERNQEQWMALKEMKSVEVYVDNPSNVQSYFLKEKGFDLKEIIHEYGTTSPDDFMSLFKNVKVWSPRANQVNSSKLWLTMARQAELWPKHFQNIEETLNNTDIMIGGIDSI